MEFKKDQSTMNLDDLKEKKRLKKNSRWQIVLMFGSNG
jgi:hypothetical protein